MIKDQNLTQDRISELKLFKNYLGLSRSQEKLSNIAISSTETEISKEVAFENVIDELASFKVRKPKLFFKFCF